MGRGACLRLGDVVQSAAVGVGRCEAVAQPCPHPRLRSPAAVPALARVRSVVAPRMRVRDGQTHRTELIEVGDADQSASRKRENPHLGVGLGKTARLASYVSRATMAALGEADLASATTEGPSERENASDPLTSRASRRLDPKPKHDRPRPRAASRGTGAGVGYSCLSALVDPTSRRQ